MKPSDTLQRVDAAIEQIHRMMTEPLELTEARQQRRQSMKTTLRIVGVNTRKEKQ